MIFTNLNLVLFKKKIRPPSAEKKRAKKQESKGLQSPRDNTKTEIVEVDARDKVVTESRTAFIRIVVPRTAP